MFTQLWFLHNGLVKMKILLIENLGNEFFADENKVVLCTVWSNYSLYVLIFVHVVSIQKLKHAKYSFLYDSIVLIILIG